jgi:hypothetical protein
MMTMMTMMTMMGTTTTIRDSMGRGQKNWSTIRGGESPRANSKIPGQTPAAEVQFTVGARRRGEGERERERVIYTGAKGEDILPAEQKSRATVRTAFPIVKAFLNIPASRQPDI